MKDSKLFKCLLATVVAVGLSAPAMASVGESNDLGGVSISVSYADLNLENEDGALSLYRRLKQASKRVCDFRGLNIAGSVSQMATTRQCYLNALSSAVEKIDNDLVTELHNS